MTKSDRIAIVASIAWPLLFLLFGQPWDWSRYVSGDIAWIHFFAFGLTPVGVYWGYWFIAAGNQAPSTKHDDQ